MTVRHLYVAAALVASMAVGGPLAADTEVRVRPGMMGVADIGKQDCATFSAMHYHGPAGMEHQVLTWVQGYVFAKTGSNIDALLVGISGGDNGWNFDTLTRVFVDYCAENPDAPVSEAAIALWGELEAGNTFKAGAEPGEPGVGPR
ncbi:MAG: hypothetical protein HKN81_08480 [Gammaproteobacteria bacterium]|nr:hypothetical protein [Gammaproteobacteria bacterium]